MQKIKVYPALNGDCFLLTIDDASILVDGGYVDTFHYYLQADLAVLDKPLMLMIVTHIDGDHISGINKLLEQNAGMAVVPIEQIWHNAFRHIQPYAIPHPVLDSFAGKRLDDLTPSAYLSEATPSNGAISARHGSTLAAYLARGGYAWNVPFDGKAVAIENGDVFDLTIAIKLRLLSPDRSKLEELYKFWRKELYKLGYMTGGGTTYFDDALEFVLAKDKAKKQPTDKPVSGTEIDMVTLAASNFTEDDTPTNGSSIAFVLEFADKKILMLGDAHPGLVAQQLEKHYPEAKWPVRFNLVKVAHHGSIMNTSPRLLDLVDSDKFLFSTNGDKYEHPDLTTIARIITRSTTQTRTLYFNYPVPLTKILDNKNLQQKYNYNLVVAVEDIPLEIEL